MQSLSRFLQAIVSARAALIAAGFVLCLLGCAKKPQLEFDNRFSINVVKTPVWFPGKDLPLAAAEREVLNRRGNPDFIRFLWNADGSPISASDFSGKSKDDIVASLATVRKSWIYLFDEKEITFTDTREGYRERPLEDKPSLICKYGDPSDRHRILLRDGHRKESWYWIQNGLQVELTDSTITNQTYLDGGTGSRTWPSI